MTHSQTIAQQPAAPFPPASAAPADNGGDLPF